MILPARHRRFELLTYGSGGTAKPRKAPRKRPLCPTSVKQVCKFPLIPTLVSQEEPARPTAWDRVLTGGAVPEDGRRPGGRPKRAR